MRLEPTDSSPKDVGAPTRLLLLLAGLASSGLAVLATFAPTRMLPWPLPPLHAACFAALHAALALPWLLAARERDGAAVRIPLAQMLAGAACTILLCILRQGDTAATRPTAGAWLAMQVLLAAGAAAWLAQRSELQAPAERPDRTLLAAAAVVGAVALLLVVAPALAARAWPWPLGPEPASLYGGGLTGWAVALLMLARERRRDARRLALQGLVGLGVLVALASWWHREAFHHPAAGLAWTASFLGLSTLAWRRLTHPGLGRTRACVRRARPSDR